MAPKKAPPKKKVYDYSGLEKGTVLQAESDGTYYAAEVLQVSGAKNRAKAPVKISYKGYDGYDEWVGGDRLRSKALKVVEKSEQRGPPAGKFKLDYWNLLAKGIGPSVALQLAGFDWELGKQPTDWENWMTMKPETVWGFIPNLELPGGKKIGCELAILQYIARKAGPALAGASEDDKLMSQELLHQAEELYQKMAAKMPTIMAPDKDPKAFKEWWDNAGEPADPSEKRGSIHGFSHSANQTLKTYLMQFEHFCTQSGFSDQGKFTKSGTTIGECKLFATLACLVAARETVLAGSPNLDAFYKRMLGMPKVKAVIDGTAANMSEKGGPRTVYFQAPK